MALIPGLENINWFSAFSQIGYWLKWGFYSILMLTVMLVLYFYLTYNIPAYIFPLYGSGKDGIFAIGKKKNNRFKWNKGKTAWKSLFPLFNRKEYEPFDSEFIYPGKQIYAFDLNGELIPGRLNVNKTEDEIRAEINPVPYYIRNWQSLQHKKNAMEYAANDWWSENKTLIAATMAGIAILAAALIFVYLTYKMAGAGRADIGALTNALRDWNTVPGR